MRKGACFTYYEVVRSLTCYYTHLMLLDITWQEQQSAVDTRLCGTQGRVVTRLIQALYNTLALLDSSCKPKSKIYLCTTVYKAIPPHQ